MATFKGRISLDIRDSEPDWEPYLAPTAPEGSPNVLFIAWDDIGYGTMDVFGGPVETPTMRRIADMGVRYANFHTTALCSPTRASLLTGRNATSNGMATIAEFSAGFPGISTRIPFENGFISEVLAERGYNTYCVGKWHLTPGEETGMAAFKGRWPLGRGFERFYGYLGGESSSWYPDLIHDNHPVDPPATPDEGYHLSRDLSDKAITFIRDAKVVDPDKPFFMYLAPQAGHAPHHVFAEWADRYKGRFDEGYEALRETILARQVELGLLPPGTELSGINPHGEPAVTGPDGTALAAARHRPPLGLAERRREAPVRAHGRGLRGLHLVRRRPAGQGDRLPRELGRAGQHPDRGDLRQRRQRRGRPQRQLQRVALLQRRARTPPPRRCPTSTSWAAPTSYNHYNTGWAWAFDTPFPYWKRWAGYEGGVADMCLVAWPARIPAQTEPRQQYVHAVDVVPTVYELLGITPPEVIKGHPQSPIEGESFAASLTDASVAGKRTQFYAMLGQRSIYHEGWLACTVHPPLGGWGGFEKDEWELYDLEHDRAQSTNLAAREPVRLETLKSLWFYYAGINNGLPLDDRSAIEQVLAERPHGTPPRDRFVYYPDCASVPGAVRGGRSAGARTRSPPGWRSTRPTPRACSTPMAGSPAATACTSRTGACTTPSTGSAPTCRRSSADREITPGAHVLTAEFAATGRSADPHMPGAAGTLTLYVDDQAVGGGEIVTQPGYFCVVGDGICVGRDDASPVTPDYRAPFRFTGGTIDKVVVDVSGERYVDHEAQVRAWFSID